MTLLDEWAARWSISPIAVHDLKLALGVVAPPVITGAKPGSEAEAQQQIRMEAPKRGIRLWRNNNGATKDETGRSIRYGLANDSAPMNRKIKSSDLIGITPVVILPNHIGMTFGVFTSIEVKRAGWKFTGSDREIAQRKWIELIISLGGYGKFATGAGDL